ncbi:hypothetical protein ACH5RR_041325 [Cinchona calisaya]|uniref:AAA+ ATPase domain-containing protein n=1 Tax=Cinchona calisaya TaxID=153742 RepID=A0ABD2XUK4_9GENT
MSDKIIDIGLGWANKYISYGKNRQKLETCVKVLEYRASDVIRITRNVVLNSGKKRKREVEEWLKSVDNMVSKFVSLKEQAEQALLPRIQFAQRVDTMIKEIENLTQQSETFSSEGFLLDVDETEGLPLVVMEWRGPSFERNLHKIWAQLMNEEITTVGIYGMGGVGKTTLAKRIHNDLLNEISFSGHVYWVTASQEASIYKLQKDIARTIDLDISNEVDEMKRAAKLFRALERREKIVILVDDVWADFDVEKVGIPLKRIKLIVTSRSVDVCRKIGCQLAIKLTPLCEEEAWELFQVKLGRSYKVSSDLKSIAKSMARKCAGLPLAITTVAGSMKGVHDIFEWRDALDDLEQYSVGEDDKVFPILEYSYNRLRDQRLKDCFLTCSLYPEDCKIDRDELIMLFISEGLIEKRSRRADFDCGHTILNKLENVCLLEGGFNISGVKFVKMHDLIRDMALKITKTGKPRYMVKAGIGLKSVPEESEWKEDLDKVSLMDNNIELIPEGISPKCFKLSILILKNSGLSLIPDSFFAHLGVLKVLDLSSNRNLRELPYSISNLNKLKSLSLQFCFRLRFVPPLGNLKALRELDLFHTSVEDVPEGIERLVELRRLNIGHTGLRIIPDGKLSELRLLRSLIILEEVAVKELVELKHLEEFQGRFFQVDDFNQFVRSLQVLDHRVYNIKLAPDSEVSNKYVTFTYWKEISWYGTRRRVMLCEIGLGGQSTEVLLPEDIRQLELCHCYNMASCLSETFLQLKLIQSRGIINCQIDNCKEIKWIVKLTSSSTAAAGQGGEEGDDEEGQISPCSPLQSLEYLRLCSLPNFEGLFEWESAVAEATLPPQTFSCLKSLVIEACPSLTKLFTSRLLLRQLQNLEVISVVDCCGLEEIIIAEEESSDIDQCSQSRNNNVVDISLSKLTNLNLHTLPNLRCIYKGTLICDSIQRISIKCCSNLKRMPLSLPTVDGKLSPPPALKDIIISERLWESLEWDNPQSRSVLQPFVKFWY